MPHPSALAIWAGASSTSLYGTTPTLFEKSWQLPDIEKIYAAPRPRVRYSRLAMGPRAMAYRRLRDIRPADEESWR
jgi:hypothetical protein